MSLEEVKSLVLFADALILVDMYATPTPRVLHMACNGYECTI